jgi:mannosyltransferase
MNEASVQKSKVISGPSPGWVTPVVLGLILAVGLAARVDQLGDRPFSFDEAWSWRVIGFPVDEMFTRLGRDVHPPLFYCLLRGWAAAFGTSPVALRSLSVALGLVTVAGTYLFTTEAFGRRTSGARRLDGAGGLGLFAAALVALSAVQIRYSWEARMYTLGTALAVFSSWALFRALRTDKTWGWLLYATLALAFAYTHYFAVFSLAAQGLFAAGYVWVRAGRRVTRMWGLRSTRYALLAAVGVVIGYLPWVPVFVRQKSQVADEYWIRTMRAWDIPLACHQLFYEPMNPQAEVTDCIPIAAVCGLALGTLLWRARAGHWCTFLAAVTPFAGCTALALLGTQLFTVRYFIFAHVFMLVALAVLIWRIPVFSLRVAVSGIVLAHFAFAHGRFTNDLEIDHRGGAKAAGEYIAENRDPAEPVLVCATTFYHALLYHSGADLAGWKLCLVSGKLTHYNGGPLIDRDELFTPTPESLDSLPAKRVWIAHREGADTLTPSAEWALRSERRFPGVIREQGTVVVREYVRHGGGSRSP